MVASRPSRNTTLTEEINRHQSLHNNIIICLAFYSPDLDRIALNEAFLSCYHYCVVRVYTDACIKYY